MNLWPLLAYPSGALIADRIALEDRPASDGPVLLLKPTGLLSLRSRMNAELVAAGENRVIAQRYTPRSSISLIWIQPAPFSKKPTPSPTPTMLTQQESV